MVYRGIKLLTIEPQTSITRNIITERVSFLHVTQLSCIFFFSLIDHNPIK